MEGRFAVFVLVIFGTVAVMAKPAWEDSMDSSSGGGPGMMSMGNKPNQLKFTRKR